jgi:hypothetical protein
MQSAVARARRTASPATPSAGANGLAGRLEPGGEGAVAFGGAVYWTRGKLWAFLPIVFGCLVATATRPYVGWFLAAAAVAVILHASLTRQRGARSVLIAGTMVLLIAAFFPLVLNASSHKSLQSLQESQNANAQDTSANLSLESEFRFARAQFDAAARDADVPLRIEDL